MATEKSTQSQSADCQHFVESLESLGTAHREYAGATAVGINFAHAGGVRVTEALIEANSLLHGAIQIVWRLRDDSEDDGELQVLAFVLQSVQAITEGVQQGIEDRIPIDQGRKHESATDDAVNGGAK